MEAKRKLIDKEVINMDFSGIKTCELVEELKTREAVEVKIADPYEDVTVNVNGPAIILVVTD